MFDSKTAYKRRVFKEFLFTDDGAAREISTIRFFKDESYRVFDEEFNDCSLSIGNKIVKITCDGKTTDWSYGKIGNFSEKSEDVLKFSVTKWVKKRRRVRFVEITINHKEE